MPLWAIYPLVIMGALVVTMTLWVIQEGRRK